MLKIYYYKDFSKQSLQALINRNLHHNEELNASVKEILEEVKKKGDNALQRLSLKFDKVLLEKLYVDAEEIEKHANTIPQEHKAALQIAYQNIYQFHQAQLKLEDPIQIMPGVCCWREHRPIERVGLYIPGGSSVLPSTFLMLGIPARIAGCSEIVVCSPPQPNALVNGYLAYCAQLLGIQRIYLVGGAQAIAAMAYGTETIVKVDKIFGPGNRYVTRAKILIQTSTHTSIDMPAGPSEVLIIADKHTNPAWVAADLLAQAEHGPDSQAILVSDDSLVIDKVNQELYKQLTNLPRASIATEALKNSYALLVENLQEAVDFSNQYAPEHLILHTEQWSTLVESIMHAGSVFLGPWAPESVGDYASGTNHVLPTSTYARSYAGVSIDSFLKKITFQHLTSQGIRQLGPTVETLATIEGLQAHKNAVSIRLCLLNSTT